ncbi:MAG: hypothetical protein IJH40_07175 [Ruminococcus sp.]|uniref:hypothetical protein n=1 Tax=Ruminococcus sp. TaxID=41978 RepID=UPI002873A1DC|nr:hypothetical protein [Ruminococcus sp.]MBQ3285407.1 hypothetical protein [Ruminococcus sp.]
MAELNVKVGDKVLFSQWHYTKTYERIATVTRVTPTGRIKVNDYEAYFNKNGGQMGGSMMMKASLSVLTPEKEKELTEAAAIRYCRVVFDKADLTYKQAVRILSILRVDKDNKE